MVEDEMPLARLGLISALADGDTGLAYRLVLDLMDDGCPFPVILDELLASVQSESGRRWEVGDASISEEHAATAAVETLVALLSGSLEQSADGRLVVLVCAEGETHTLPARMAAALLAYEGFRTIFFGTSLPAHDLRGYLALTSSDALVVSCTRAANLPGARALIAAGHDAGIPVAVGGRAFGNLGRRADALGADAYAPTLTALPELLERWQPDPAAAERATTVRADPPIPDASTRLSVAAQLLQFLGDGAAAADASDRLLTDCAHDLVDTTVAALYLDDATVLADHARWLAELLARRAQVAPPAEQILGWLRHTIADTMPGAGPLVDASIAALRPDR